ncbi:unnamed protein product [Rhodiola kirilowii]
MLARDSNAVRSWRSEKQRMEGLESVRTIECLRDRLLAERAASKLARHEAQLLENQLSGLENKLNEETKFKNKAEKKLKFLLNKLQSLKIDYALENSEDFGSAEDATEYSIKESIPARCTSENVEPQIITGRRSGGSSSYSEDGSSTITTNSETNAQNGPVEKFLDLKPERSVDRADHVNQRTNELKSSEEHGAAEISDADKSLALVPVLQTSSSSEKTDGKLKMSDYSDTVAEALSELRRAREEIERSMERRREIKVRWAQLVSS